MTDKGLQLAMVLTAGVGIAALMTMRVKDSRFVTNWRKNADGSCTYIYDDGSEETATCTEPPA
jgi:hypothetical protein